jgi:aspartyl-tRNA(Asn)/glutamyl-tRNA(Gln) amidotransferase subunit C
MSSKKYFSYSCNSYNVVKRPESMVQMPAVMSTAFQGVCPMKITIADVEHVARLARLELSTGEKCLFADQMDAILGYAEKLNELNTEGILPTSHAVPMENAFREDLVQPSIGVEKALSNAPDPALGFYRVPKVIE